MIAFLTLLLGLIAGVYPIEVTVSGPVAAVEFVLDGTVVGRIDGPPWRAPVDLGAGLAPHELVARALDKDGNELARARQWVNLPRPAAEVEIVLEGDGSKPPASARLTWQSLTGNEPMLVQLTFDGLPLAVDAERRAKLPAYDPAVAHVLTAEVRFSPFVSARRDVAFGGEWGSQISTELTALPVHLRKGEKLPPVERLQSWFLAGGAGGSPLSVAAVEEGAGLLFIVRAAAPEEISRKVGGAAGRKAPGQVTREFDRVQRYEIQLGPEDEVRFLSPTARSYRGEGIPAELFDVSRPFTSKDGGLPWMLQSSFAGSSTRDPNDRRVADAVAVAGLQAMAGNRRRAVLLVLGGNPANSADPANPVDTSRYDPATIRRYLEAIRVPLFVWTVEPGSPQAAAWGAGAVDVSSRRKLLQAAKELRAELASQRIVWLEGRHLPQAVTLAPEAQGSLRSASPIAILPLNGS
jgi:hypothetical protein